jgi:putative membrane protein
MAYHWQCAVLLRQFAGQSNTRSHVWYRWFNEAPVMLMLVIVVLVVVKPF